MMRYRRLFFFSFPFLRRCSLGSRDRRLNIHYITGFLDFERVSWILFFAYMIAFLPHGLLFFLLLQVDVSGFWGRGVFFFFFAGHELEAQRVLGIDEGENVIDSPRLI